MKKNETATITYSRDRIARLGQSLRFCSPPSDAKGANSRFLPNCDPTFNSTWGREYYAPELVCRKLTDHIVSVWIAVGDVRAFVDPTGQIDLGQDVPLLLGVEPLDQGNNSLRSCGTALPRLPESEFADDHGRAWTKDQLADLFDRIALPMPNEEFLDSDDDDEPPFVMKNAPDL